MKLFKVIVLFGVCWIFPIAAILIYINYLFEGIEIDQTVIDIVSIYFWTGLIYLIVDLWMSRLDRSKKITWTVIAVFLVFLLPYYWYKYLLKDQKISGERQKPHESID